MNTKKREHPTGVRIPKRLKEKLNAAREENDRSLNAEILFRLDLTFQLEESGALEFLTASTTLPNRFDKLSDIDARVQVLEEAVEGLLSSA